jgi:hypothetical protein
MRTSFHHQPEAQHLILQLSTSWQADYPIFWGGDLNRSTQHLLILLDKEVVDGDVTDIVHGEAEG